jgi:hypothetical protein
MKSSEAGTTLSLRVPRARRFCVRWAGRGARASRTIPRIFPLPMPRSGVPSRFNPFYLCKQMNSEEKFQENSLKLHGAGHILGMFRLVLIPAGRDSRGAQHDKSVRAWPN